MRICYIAVHEQNAGWGAETFLNRGFIAEGHETICIDYRNNRRPQIPEHDVLFLQRGDGFPTRLLETDKPKFFWATELTSRQPDQARLFKWGKWDHLFVHSEECRQIALEWMPEERVSILHAGFDAELHHDPGRERDIDVLHVGTMTSRRKRILADLPVRVETAYGEDMAALFQRAKIVLNIHATERLDVETRLYEAMACGAFVLTEPLPDYSPFVDDVYLWQTTQMAEDIRTLLADVDDDRALIAADGHEYAVKHHSYRARARQILEKMEET